MQETPVLATMRSLRGGRQGEKGEGKKQARSQRENLRIKRKEKEGVCGSAAYRRRNSGPTG